MRTHHYLILSGDLEQVFPLLSTTSDWLTMLESGKDICAVFFDYRKAFDSVPHRPLMEKLSSLGLNVYLMKWITEYLTNRSQWVVVEGETSSPAQVLSGVPQGSVLGPLLFLIYIDEVTTNSLSQSSWCNLFADDLLLYNSYPTRKTS